MFKNPLRRAVAEIIQMASDFGNTSTTTSEASLSLGGKSDNFATRGVALAGTLTRLMKLEILVVAVWDDPASTDGSTSR